MVELKTKREVFCREYIVDFNGTQAAIRAGYKPDNARVTGSELLTFPDVQERVSELIAERVERTQVTADSLLLHLAEESKADLADLYDDQGAIKPIKDWPLIWRQGLVSSVDTAQVGDDSQVTIIKLKLSDRTKIRELIGKHINIQAFKNKVETTTGLSDEMTELMKHISDSSTG